MHFTVLDASVITFQTIQRSLAVNQIASFQIPDSTQWPFRSLGGAFLVAERHSSLQSIVRTSLAIDYSCHIKILKNSMVFIEGVLFYFRSVFLSFAFKLCCLQYISFSLLELMHFTVVDALVITFRKKTTVLSNQSDCVFSNPRQRSETFQVTRCVSRTSRLSTEDF